MIRVSCLLSPDSKKNPFDKLRVTASFASLLFLKFLRKLAFGTCVECFYELMDTSEWLVVEDLQQLLHFALGVLHFTLTIGPVS